MSPRNVFFLPPSKNHAVSLSACRLMHHKENTDHHTRTPSTPPVKPCPSRRKAAPKTRGNPSSTRHLSTYIDLTNLCRPRSWDFDNFRLFVSPRAPSLPRTDVRPPDYFLFLNRPYVRPTPGLRKKLQNRQSPKQNFPGSARGGGGLRSP